VLLGPKYHKILFILSHGVASKLHKIAPKQYLPGLLKCLCNCDPLTAVDVPYAAAAFFLPTLTCTSVITIAAMQENYADQELEAGHVRLKV
jgi:hypothetical protein